MPQKNTQRRNRRGPRQAPIRQNHYRQVHNTLALAQILSTDEVAAIHEAALDVLEDLGIRVLLAEARQRFRQAGAMVDESEAMVRLDRAMVMHELQHAPKHIEVATVGIGRELHIGGNNLIFGPGAGCPNVTDLDRGRRPGTLQAFSDFIKLQQHFDIIHKLGPGVEPQDIPAHLRHYEMMRTQLTLSDKVPFIYSRGQHQVLDGFEMFRLGRGLSEEEFRAKPWVSTVINTNSPRQLDAPMSRGIIDFAAWNQLSVITPFCLSGAMAPITIAGALTLSHAEALAGIVLAQITHPGAPVVYGAFSSNVDMRSGAPVFGTPEHVKTNFAAGQLARYIGMPWRSGAGTAANATDIQGAYETQFSIWGAILGGANLIYHAAGWLEGGLSISYEKFITDIEILQMLAETMTPISCSPQEIAFDAIAAVEPGGHFFGAEHTLARYSTQFYEPLISDWSNYGQWHEAGARTTAQAANTMWKRTLEEFEPPPIDAALLEELDAFITRRTRDGGAAIGE